MTPDLTISIISADNVSLLQQCLRSIFECTQTTSLEIIVVDNASSDDTSAVVVANFPHVQVIRNLTRQGFSTNNNLVLGCGQGRYLMLLNDDTIVHAGSLDAAIRFMDLHPEAGAAGCSLRNPDGSFQPYFARLPNPITEGLLPTGYWSHVLVADQSQPFETDSVCGAALIVRRRVLEEVGGLDIAFDPIYSEEIDWCYRIKQAGWKIYALPQAPITHYGGFTMNRAVPRKYELLLSHRVVYFRKHSGALAADVYRLLLGFSTAVKLCMWTCAHLLRPHNQLILQKRALHRYILECLPQM